MTAEVGGGGNAGMVPSCVWESATLTSPSRFDDVACHVTVVNMSAKIDNWMLVELTIVDGRDVVSSSRVVGPLSDISIGATVLIVRPGGDMENVKIIRTSNNRDALIKQLVQKEKKQIIQNAVLITCNFKPEEDIEDPYASSGSSWAPEEAGSSDSEPELEIAEKLNNNINRKRKLEAAIARSSKSSNNRISEQKAKPVESDDNIGTSSGTNSTQASKPTGHKKYKYLINDDYYAILKHKSSRLFDLLIKFELSHTGTGTNREYPCARDILNTWKNICNNESENRNTNQSENNGLTNRNNNNAQIDVLKDKKNIVPQPTSPTTHRINQASASDDKKPSRSGWNISEEKQTKNLENNNDHKTDERVPIGSGKTFVSKSLYRKINFKSYTTATRGLLQAVFSRKTLATHSLTGKPSPAFQNKPAKMCLDPKKVNDILFEVSTKCNVKENFIRTIITTKCADECKMYRMRMEKMKKQRQSTSATNQENEPP